MPRIGDVVRPPAFRVEPYDRYDKSITVKGPEGLAAWFDNDDVAPWDCRLVEQAVRILNEHWEPITLAVCENEDCGEAYRYYVEVVARSSDAPAMLCPHCQEPLETRSHG